ncbi:MAG: hypothetical protein E7408_05820 [Ruminococcaceae bacterium]|nr:hypothetical protein [Oscillospiraceae bacterium]
MKHSKITSIILALCMLATLMVMPAAAEGTFGMTDGSFENWGVAEDKGVWQTNIPSLSTATMTPDNTEAVDDVYSVKIAGEEFASRHALYQNIGKLPVGETVKVSLKVNVKGLTAGGVRLLVRFGSDAGTVWKGLIANQDAVTEGWKELSVMGLVAEGEAAEDAHVVFDVKAGSAGVEVYVDDFKAEVVKPTVPNGDFENGGADWQAKSPAAAADYIVTENDNSCIKFTASGQYISRELKGLTPNVTYKISFDICTNEGVGYVDNLGTPAGSYFEQYNSNGEWQRLFYTFTNGDGVTTRNIRLMFNNSAATADAYAMFDNVTIEEYVLKDHVAAVQSFEYGDGAHGWIKHATYNNITYTNSQNAIDGKYALEATRPADATGYAQLQYGFPLDGEGYYEFSAYIKNVSLDSAGYFGFRPSGNEPGGASAFKSIPVTELPEGKWVRVRYILYRNLTGNETLQLRFGGTGTMLVDKLSCKKIDAPIINYAKADGEYSEKLVNGGGVSFVMPAAFAGDIAALAVYRKTENIVSLADVKVKAITAEDVTNGYAEFTLTAGTLADFDTGNYYAKVLTVKNGTLVPETDYILLTK